MHQMSFGDRGPLGEPEHSPDPLAVAGERDGNEGRETKGEKKGRREGKGEEGSVFSKVDTCALFVGLARACSSLCRKDEF